MALQPASNYGLMNRRDHFGDVFLANDGNGDLYREDIKINSLRPNEKLSDIMELRAHMAMSPMEGDHDITALLDLDEHLLKTGKIDHELITDLYPDIGEYLYRLLMEDDDAAVAVGEIIEPVASIPDFPDSAEDVLPLLEKLAANQADQVLSVLLQSGMDQQVAAIQEAKSEESSQSPLVAA